MDTRQKTAPSGNPGQRTWGLAVFGAVGVVVIVGGLGAVFYRQQRTAIKNNARDQLNAIADLKVGQIVRWRFERMMDANYLAGSRATARDIETLLTDPTSREARWDTESRGLLLTSDDRYEKFRVFTPDGRVLFAVPPDISSTSETARRFVAEALNSQRPFLTDLHVDDSSNHIHISLFVPMFRTADRLPPSPSPEGKKDADSVLDGIPPGARPMAVIQLEIDPSHYLYPLIQSWPTPSATAETLLVRRDGNDVLFVNELRHRKDTALTLRIPLSRADLPASMAIEGKSVMVEGLDYRNEPVLAALRPVPDTPWFMVSKVDQSEVYEVLRRRATLIGLLALATSIAGVAGIGLFWRRHESAFLRTELGLERERASLAQRYALLMENANDAITLTDGAGRIVEVNRRTEELYGYSCEELQKMRATELRAPRRRGEFEAQAKETRDKGSLVFETEHQRRDGGVFPVEVSARVVDIGGESYKLGIIRDISVRKAHEAEIVRLNRLYSFLSQVNQTLVRARDRQEFLDEVCRVATEHGGFTRAWIGWMDEDGQTIRPIAASGYGSGKDRSEASSGPKSCGVAAKALRDTRACVCEDPNQDPLAEACCDDARQGTFQSCASVPLQFQGNPCGTLNLCAGETGFFQPLEMETLQEVALDISFGIDALEKEKERKQAEEALKASEQRFRLFYEQSPVAYQSLDAGGNLLEVNGAWLDELGYTREEVIGQNFAHFLAGDGPALFPERFEKFKTAGETHGAEFEMKRKDGGTILVSFEGRIGRDAAGAFQRTHCVFVNVTERRRMELALRHQEMLWREAGEVAHVGGWEFDPLTLEGNWTEETARIHDVDPAEGTNAVKGMSFYQGESRARIEAAVREAIAQGAPYDLELEMVTAKGRHKWVRTICHPVIQDGKVVRMRGSFQDITERKRAEQAMKASETRYRRLFESAKDGVFILDADSGRIVDVNPFLIHLLGYSHEEFLEKRLWEMGQFKNIAATQDAFLELQREEYIRYEDLPLETADGRVINVEFVSNVYLVNHTKVIQCNIRDITERKRAEEALRVSEERFRQVAESAGEFIWEVDANGLYLYASPIVEKILGYAPDELVGKTHFYDLFAPEVREELKASALEAFARKQSLRSFPNPNIRKDGRVVILETSGAPVLDETGNLLGYRGTDSDITDRKKTEQALQEQNDRISLLNRVAKATGECRAPEEMADCLVAILREAMPCDAAYVDAFDEVNLLARGIRVYDTLDGAFGSVPPRTVSINPQGSVDPILFFRRKTVRILRAQEPEKGLYMAAFGDTARRSASLLYAPMISRNRVVGSVSVQSYSHNAYSEKDETLLLEIARQAGPAFESIQLYSETKRAEEALRIGEAQLSNALKIAHLGPWEYDVANDLFTFNDHFYGIFRTTAEQVGGYSMSSSRYAQLFLHPDDAALVGVETRKALETNDPHYTNQLEHRILYADGEIGYITVRIFVVKDDKGRTVRTHGVNQDVTERRRAEGALRESERKYRDLVQNAREAIFVVQDDSVVFANRMCEEFTGLNSKDLIGRPIVEFAPEEDRQGLLEHHRRLVAGEIASDQNEYRLMDNNNTVRWISNNAVAISWNGRPATLNFATDITERRKLEDQLRQAQKMEAVGQLAGGVAHDFNNMLQVINGYTEMALDEIDPGHRARPHLEEVFSAGERAKKLVGQLLAFGRKQVLRPRNLDINEVVAELLKMLGRLLGEHVRVNFTPGPSIGSVLADRGQVEQILINLSVNARDAMPDGGVLQIETQNVALSEEYCQNHFWATPGRYVLISVSDTGHGMDADTLAHAFEPFFTTKDVGKGTGLGLATVYGIVRQHQGLIHVYSEPGEGTRFRIYLPRVEGDQGPEEEVVEDAAALGGVETILLAEDEALVRNFAREVLAKAGYTVLVADDGDEALRLAEELGEDIRLALLDIVMPTLGGYGVYERLKDRFPAMRFLFASGYSVSAVHTNFVLKEGLELIQKPFSPGDLLRHIRRILDAPRGPEDAR